MHAGKRGMQRAMRFSEHGRRMRACTCARPSGVSFSGSGRRKMLGRLGLYAE